MKIYDDMSSYFAAIRGFVRAGRRKNDFQPFDNLEELQLGFVIDGTTHVVSIPTIRRFYGVDRSDPPDAGIAAYKEDVRRALRDEPHISRTPNRRPRVIIIDNKD